MPNRRLAAVVAGVAIVAAGCASIPQPRTSSPGTSSSSTASPATAPSSSSRPTLLRWTPVDLPTPADGDPRPLGITALRGAYVAVGTLWGACTCDRPPFERSVAWTSADGRTWTLHDGIATFARSSLRGVVTDGSRLVAFGYAMPAADDDDTRVPAAWSSEDGSTWTRSPDPAPSIVAVGSDGFVGAIPVNEYSDPSARAGSVRFVASADGLAWRSTSRSFEADLGDGTEGSSIIGEQMLAASPSRGLMATGSVPADSGEASAVAWRSADGIGWDGPLGLAEAATPRAIAASGDAFLVAVLASSPADGTSRGEVRRLTGGTLPSSPVLSTDDGSAINQLFGVGDLVVAAGLDATGRSVAWASTDGGASFHTMEGTTPFTAGPATSVTALVASPDGLIATGGHPQPTVWIGR